jgi:hypothetical protein
MKKLDSILKQFEELLEHGKLITYNRDNTVTYYFKEARDLITLAYNAGRDEACEEIMGLMPKVIEPPKIEAKITKRQYWMTGQMNYGVRWQSKIKSLSQSKENLIKEEKEI